MVQRIETTADGSHTIFSEDFGAQYHSSHGSVQESMTVFIENGLFAIEKKKIDILEIGFGTGLNAALTFDQTLTTERSISYLGIEKHPISIDLVDALNYSSFFTHDSTNDMLKSLHSTHHVMRSSEKHSFIGKLVIDDVFQIAFDTSFDLIYFDAFAPSIQEKLWKVPFLDKMFKALRPGGILTTYCAQGQFKRNLKEVGFMVESLPGPTGKREMTRARVL